MQNKYPSQTADRFLLRFPDGMRERIAESAASNNRTMTKEVILRLQQSFEPSNTEQLRDLQLELARAQSVALEAQRQALFYSMALMYIGGRIPPEVLADAPEIATLIKTLNTGRKAQLVEAASKMLANGVDMAASIDRLIELQKAVEGP
jgi:sensor histidine kinase YesM